MLSRILLPDSIRCMISLSTALTALWCIIELRIKVLRAQDMPAQYLFEPWKAPEDVQKKARCIIGKDYPKPLVDHATKHKQNLDRMKSAYDANKSPPKRKEISDGFDEMYRHEVMHIGSDDE